MDPVVTASFGTRYVANARDEFISVDDAIVRLDLFGADGLPSISHSICGACDDEFGALVGG